MPNHNIWLLGYEEVKWPENGGLGYTPWPGSFVLAKYLDTHREELGLQEKKVLELGSGLGVLGNISY